MNKDIIAGRWKQLLGTASIGLGRITDSNWTTLRGRVEHFFGQLQERHGLARDHALAAIDECSTAAAAPDADQLADLNLDSDYGSSPRLGMDNLAATPVPEPTPGPVERIEAALGRLVHGFGHGIKQHPGVSLIAAASLGFVTARLATPRRGAR